MRSLTALLLATTIGCVPYVPPVEQVAVARPITTAIYTPGQMGVLLGRKATYLFSLSRSSGYAQSCAQRTLQGDPETQNWQMLYDVAIVQQAFCQGRGLRLHYVGTAERTGCMILSRSPQLAPE